MEVKIILILLIIHLLGIIIIKPKVNILSCGIFAWAGKSVKTFNKAKFDIQGLYNDSRGGDSCGVTTDGEIYYGINISKHYGAFLHKQGYEHPLMIPTVIGHTRKSSSGTVNSDNAHPFGFGDYEKTFEFVGVHNGTLQNESELAKNYDVETIVRELNGFNINAWKRNKIDSEILLEIIYKNKNYKVLSDYIGGAALLFTNTLEPNVLYAFKGASRLDSYDRGADIEERPLYYYKESKNSLYISSLQESLEAIGGTANEDLFSFSPNTVYKITDGNIATAEKIEISRRNSHQKPFTYKKTYNVCGYEWDARDKVKDCEWQDLRESSKTDKGKKEKGVEKILEEKDVRIYKSPITFNKLRYNRNGHLINGICVWIKEYGFHLLSDDAVKADRKVKTMIGTAFDMEYGCFAEEGISLDLDDDQTIFPFTVENKKIPSLFYFYEGIMLETRVDYAVVSSNPKNYTIWDLSEMSKHPIIEVKTSSSYSKMYESILYKRVSFTGNVCPLGSSKIYYISQGVLVSTIVKEKEEEEKYFSAVALYNKNLKSNTLFDINKSDDELIKKSFADFCELNKLEVSNSDEDEDKKIENDFEKDKVIKESVNTLMVPIYLKIQENVDALEEFKDKDFVEEIIELNEEYLTSLDEIIDKNYK